MRISNNCRWGKGSSRRSDWTHPTVAADHAAGPKAPSRGVPAILERQVEHMVGNFLEDIKEEVSLLTRKFSAQAARLRFLENDPNGCDQRSPKRGQQGDLPPP